MRRAAAHLLHSRLLHSRLLHSRLLHSRLLHACAMVALASCGGARGAREQMAVIPMQTVDGEAVRLSARICRPDADAKARVAIVNHAALAGDEDRRDMAPYACGDEPVRWFLARGFVVVAPLRRGYGDSEGDWAENAGACATPDYVRAGEEAARDMAAVARFAANLPYARPDHMVVVGEDAGGWAAIAFDAAPHAPVSAFVNVAGGRGARSGADPRHVCRPDLLVDAAAHFGATARTPMLWLYAADDRMFSPEIVAGLHAGFERGGGRVAFVQVDPIGMDGHAVFSTTGGSAIWGPFVARYLDGTGS